MNKRKYDYLILGSGLFGVTFACRVKKAGKSCLIIDKRAHLGGDVYCESIEGINVHKYGDNLPYLQQRSLGLCLGHRRIQPLYEVP